MPTTCKVAQKGDRRFLHELVELLLGRVAWFSMFFRCSRVVTMHNPGLSAARACKQCFQCLILEPPGLRIADRILQRLDAVQDEQRAMLADQPGQPFAAFPWAALCRVGVVEELERLLDEQVGRRLPRFAGPLAVERPIEVAFDARPALGRHPLADPVGDERRLADTAPGDQRVDIQSRICPRRIKGIEPLVAAEEDRGRMLGDARRGDFDLITAPVPQVDDIATVETWWQLAVVDANRNDFLTVFPRKLHLAIDPV